MNRYLIFITLVSVLNVCQANLECRQPSSSILSSIVRVETDQGHKATGIVIADNVILTAAHVINGSKNIFVKSTGSTNRAQLRSVDQKHDLATLAASTDELVPVPFAMNEPHENQMVWAVGYPLGGDLTMSSGNFEDRVGDNLHTSASINLGQSGGGLITCEANQHVLAGMLRAFTAYQEGDKYVRIDNFSISVPAQIIESFALN